MPLAAADLARLSNLLDEAMTLDPPALEVWLAGLQAVDAAELGSTLRRLLAQRATPATSDLLERGPAFAPSFEPDDAASPAFEPGDALGPYRLLRELGQGGMGEVWLAERADGQLKRPVALKLPLLQARRPELAQRFARERDILAGLSHPNIARLYDAGLADDGQPYLALEYVEGQPIDAWCRARGVAVEDRLRLLLQVADAVAFAHSRLVVHRDLKPANILVTAAGEVRLLDFGIAKLLEGETAAETALTRASGRAMTLDYASPEQIRGEPIGTPSDVYSLAVVAFELLAGARPYRLRHQSAAQLEEAITQIDAPLASEVATEAPLKRRLRGELDAILNKALKKQPGDRYPTVDALALDWRRHLDGGRVFARPDTAGYRLQRLARRHRLPLAVGAAVTAAFALGIGAGATALVIFVLLVGLAGSLWQTRRAAQDRDRAFELAARNEAVSDCLNLLLTQAAQGGQAVTAQQLLERAEQLVEQEFKHHPEHRATVLAMIGMNAQTLGQPGRAVQLLLRALDAARSSHDRDLLDTLASQHALNIGWLGRVHEAIAVLEPIVARRSTQPEQRAEAHHYLALLANSISDAGPALHHAGEALRWLRLSRRSSPRLESSFLASLGSACSLNGRIDEADRHYEAATAKFASLGLAGGTHAVALFNNWGVLNERAGDVRRALAVCERALLASQEAGAPPSPYVAINRARALEGLGRLEQAEAGYRQGLEIGRNTGNALVIGNALLSLASVAVSQGRAEQALAWMVEAGEDLPAPTAVMRLIVQGRLALLQGNDAAAASSFSAAVGERPALPGTFTALLGRSQAHRRLRALPAALADAQDALALAEKLQGGKPHSFRTGLAWLALAQLQRQQHDAAAAQRAADMALVQLAHAVDAEHPALAEASRMAQQGP